MLAHIASAVPGSPGASSLRLAAERIAAGDLTAPGRLLPGLPSADAAAIVHAALTQGFGWVMLCGGIGVWILAAASFLVFDRKAVSVR